ncbi:DUF4166 domain-containing protein [Gordonia mangrovi]|uniref:DUF4166 domain-containing protein n=1 Tax=Gordonia mangrovi TaxID=2665643 RepID=UPI001F3AB4EA|nr:DUF4166 domain-containing protein [Gordonia mangrovi]UVF76894.1 DUF4166 domain-containing protein [Gordonia mangrovi]
MCNDSITPRQPVEPDGSVRRDPLLLPRRAGTGKSGDPGTFEYSAGPTRFNSVKVAASAGITDYFGDGPEMLTQVDVSVNSRGDLLLEGGPLRWLDRGPIFGMRRIFDARMKCMEGWDSGLPFPGLVHGGRSGMRTLRHPRRGMDGGPRRSRELASNTPGADQARLAS